MANNTSANCVGLEHAVIIIPMRGEKGVKSRKLIYQEKQNMIQAHIHPCSQNPNIGPFPVSDKSSPHPYNLFIQDTF